MFPPAGYVRVKDLIAHQYSNPNGTRECGAAPSILIAPITVPSPPSLTFPCLLLLFIALLSISAFTPAQASPAESLEAGTTWYQAGDFHKALADGERAIIEFQATGDLEGQVIALVLVAEANLALGQHPKALDKLSGALALAEKSGNPSLLAIVTSSLGKAYLFAGYEAEAKKMLESSAELATEAGNPDTAASALNNLGGLHSLGMAGFFVW